MSKLRGQFSKNLKKLRNDKKMTQEQLAEKLNISLRYVQQLEGKNTPNVKIDTIEKLARTLRCKPEDLLK